MSATTSAKDLIAEVVRVYRGMSSYQDNGVVLQPLQAGEEPIPTRFTTHFVRPDMFRFTFSSPHPFPPLAHLVTEHVCGTDKSGAYSWTKHAEDAPEIEDAESFSMAIAGATGISGGSAHTIATLLLDEVGGFDIEQSQGPEFAGEETFEGADCLVLRASHPIGGELKYWIERDTLLLRKVRTDLGRFPAGDEIRRNIVVNGEIAESTFDRPVA